MLFRSMQSLVNAPLANALRLNLVEVEGAPKKRAPSVRTLQMYKTEPGIVKRAQEHREGKRWAKVKAGECHVMPYPNPADLDAMRKDQNVNLMSSEGLNIGYWAFNTKPP